MSLRFWLAAAAALGGWSVSFAGIALRPGHAAVDVPFASAPKAFTAAATFRPEQVPQNLAIPGFVYACGDALSNGFALRLQSQGENYVVQLCMGDGKGAAWVNDVQPELRPGRWSQAVVCWDGAKLALHVNGVKMGETPRSGAFAPAANGLLSLNRAAHGYQYYPLDLAEFRLEERAWGDEEIRRFFAAKPADDPALEALVRTLRRVAQGEAASVAELTAYAGALHPLVEARREEALAFASLAEGRVDAAVRYAEARMARATPLDEPERRYDFLPRFGAALLKRGEKALGRRYLAEVYERLRDADANTLPLAAQDFARTLRAAGEDDWAGWIERQAEELSKGTVWEDVLRKGGPLVAVPGCPPEARRAENPSVAIFVSPTGDDDAPGSFEHPVKTPAKAVELLTAAFAKGAPAGGAAVWFRGGRYPVRETVVLRDLRGTAEAPILIGAWEGEKPVFSGAVTLAGGRSAADEARLPTDEARRNVRVYDLAANGVAALAPQPVNGFGARMRPSPLLLEGDGVLTVARHPNAGFLRTVAPQKFNRGILTDRGFLHGDAFKGVKDGFLSDLPDLARFAGEKELMVHAYWRYLWADRAAPVKSVDPQTGAVTMDLAQATEQPSVKSVADQVPGDPYFLFNALAALDAPGEWFADRAAGRLYVWPRGRGDVRLTALAGTMLELRNVGNVRFEGLVFEGGAADAVSATAVTNAAFVGCGVRGFGGCGLRVEKGFNVLVRDCAFAQFGRGALALNGGDRATLAPGHVRVENCEASDGNLCHRVHPMCIVSGVGNAVRGSRFHDTLSSVFRVEGNDHVFVSNDVRRAVQECDDNAAVDMYRCPSYAGCKYLYNVFEDCGGGEIAACGQAAIRFDGNISGMTVCGNVFRRAGTCFFGAINVNGGRNNVIDSNRFEACPLGVSTFFYPPWRWREIFEGTDGNARYVRDQTEGRIDIRRAPYATAYPRLRALRYQPQVNFITRNVSVGGVVDPGCPAPTALYGNASVERGRK